MSAQDETEPYFVLEFCRAGFEDAAAGLLKPDTAASMAAMCAASLEARKPSDGTPSPATPAPLLCVNCGLPADDESHDTTNWPDAGHAFKRPLPATPAPSLRELAERATPGPWNATDSEDSRYRWCVNTPGLALLMIAGMNEADARYIAACSPDAILALLDEMGRLRAKKQWEDGFLCRVAFGRIAHLVLGGEDGTPVTNPEAVLTAVESLRSALQEAQEDTRRWQFIRERLVIEDEEMMSGAVRSTIRIRIGQSVIGDGLPYAYKPEEVESVIDAAIDAAAGSTTPS